MEMKNNIIQEETNKKTVWYKSPWVIVWISLVLIVLSVNIYMVTQSITGFSGLVSPDFYERGENYEKNMHKKLAQNHQWTPSFKLQEMHVDKATTIAFSLKDKQGKQPKMENVTLYVYRPSDAKKDFSMPMLLNEETQQYQAELTFALKGKWDIIGSSLIDGAEVNYGKEIFVKD